MSPVHGTARSALPYVVVHIVSQETLADLIGPQVIDPLRLQARINGSRAPRQVIAVFLEAARVAVRKDLRARLAAFRARAPEVKVLLHPFVSRFGIRRNAMLLAIRLRWMARRHPIVFHCRGENAVEWALALQRYVPNTAIVADIRGAWPEEFLFARGFDGPAGADAESLQAYRELLRRLHEALRHAVRIFSVSQGMLSWLAEQGASKEKLTYVPCCVPGPTFDMSERERIRRELDLGEQLVVTYMGTLNRYQHIEDGVVPFVRAMILAHSDVHFLALVSDPARLRRILDEHGVPSSRATLLNVPQSAVAQYLSAADVGLLLRGPSRMNRFSQPTKLGEYLAAGLAVVVSRGTGQVDAMIEENEAGLVVDVFGVPASRIADEAERVWRSMRMGADQIRQNALALCAREFKWSAYTERVRDAYADSVTSTAR